MRRQVGVDPQFNAEISDLPLHPAQYVGYQPLWWQSRSLPFLHPPGQSRRQHAIHLEQLTRPAADFFPVLVFADLHPGLRIKPGGAVLIVAEGFDIARQHAADNLTIGTFRRFPGKRGRTQRKFPVVRMHQTQAVGFGDGGAEHGRENGETPLKDRVFADHAALELDDVVDADIRQDGHG